MKVLHIGKYFPPYAGGMETYLRDLMVAQQRQGLEASALVHQSNLSLKSSDECYQADNIEVPITRAALWARLLFTPISPTFPWLLSKLIKTNKPDLLHLHMPNVSAFWALFLPSARRIPWVVHWHADVLASNHSLGLRLFYGLYRPFEKAILRQARAIIATSPPYLKSSEPLQNYRDKCEVIPLGLDPENLAHSSQVIERKSPSILRVLAIGRLTYYKGFEYLIRAVASLDSVELHLVGTGELEKELTGLTRELKAADKVFFHGKLSNSALAAQYMTCDCLCLPSIERTEAFGMVLLEAMSHSKGTVIADVPGSGMGWVVEDKVTGLHAPPEDASALAECLRHLLQNRDKISALGENSRVKFDRMFNIEVSAAAITQLYSIVLLAAAKSQ